MSTVWEKEFRLGKHQRKSPDKLVTRFLRHRSREIRLILDIGCGTGRHIVYLAKRKFLVCGIDISPTALLLAQKWLRKENINRYLLVKHTMTCLPFQDSQFDAVIAIDTLEHQVFQNIKSTIREIKRVLRKGGLFLLVTKSTDDPWFGKGKKIEKNTYRFKGKIHHFFDETELKRLLAGFTIFILRKRILRKGSKKMVKWEVAAKLSHKP